MISRQKIDFIRGLARKREREIAGCFVAEGEKLVFDLLETSLTPVEIYATLDGQAACKEHNRDGEVILISEKEMERISAFKNPSSLLALFKIPSYQEVERPSFDGLSLVLDGIQDPGNLGTIVRTADWFGITHIYCSPECADLFNPKCVQSTMGALARVRVHYTELIELTRKALDQHIPVYGTFMEGENLFITTLEARALIVMGSEGKGISPELIPLLTMKISIPAFPAGSNKLESLNVAVSAAVVCAEFRRRVE